MNSREDEHKHEQIDDAAMQSLEAELRTFKPAPPSPQVHEQVERRLRRFNWRPHVFAAAATIAVTGGVWLLQRPSPPPHLLTDPIVIQPRAQEPDRLTSSASDVSAWRYHLAARRSPERLVQLLDEQAAASPALGGATPDLQQLLESQS